MFYNYLLLIGRINLLCNDIYFTVTNTPSPPLSENYVIRRNGPEWTGMDRNGPEWTGMNRNDTGMDRNGPEWTGMDRNGTGMDRNGPE